MAEKNAMAVIDSFEELMQKRGISFPRSSGRGHHLSQEQRDWKKMREEKQKITHYISWIRNMKGTGRRSLSRTDEDATFMRMKEDPMRNGQLKILTLARCFNAQSRTEVLLCSLLMGAANSQKRFMQQPRSIKMINY